MEIKWAKGSKTFETELKCLCLLFAKAQSLYLASLQMGWGDAENFKIDRFYRHIRGGSFGRIHPKKTGPLPSSIKK